MNQKIRAQQSFLQTQHLALMIFLCLIGVGKVSGQEAPNQDKVRRRVAIIMSKTLKRGEGEITQNGEKIKVWTRMPPDTKDVEEIQRYGDAAVPVLAEYLKSGSPSEKDFAMQFLGVMGGSRIVEPLLSVIQNDDSPAMRKTALRWITQAPWDMAGPIIEKAAESDPDPDVREEAKQLLKSSAPK